MNERIFELCIQAKREFDEHVAECKHLGKQIEWVTEERLVELVVRECAELSVNSQYANIKSEYYEGFNEALIYVGNKIRKHFGVEA